MAILNLDVAFEVCFYEGFNTYAKTWLSILFPMYLFTLIILIIIVGHYSQKFARLIGKSDPVATLSTLILIYYAKLVLITITVFSYAEPSYPPGGESKTVWFPDASVKCFEGKHIALVIVALIITIIGVPIHFYFFFGSFFFKHMENF